MLPPGTRLGPYEIQSPLGLGGMGQVYRALDTRTQLPVALKVLGHASAQADERLARFQQEARTLAAIEHPALPAIYGWDTDGATPYIAMELLEGETLHERLLRGALPPDEAMDLAHQLALGLAATHERGIIHRDLKPGNLFITTEGRLKILDFGLSKALPTLLDEQTLIQRPETSHQTQVGTMMGTVGYMAPEQIRGREVDPRADLFVCGILLYEMLFGRRAFSGESPVEVLNAILKDEPPMRTASPSPYSPELINLLKHCLEKNPEDRIPTAQQLASRLAALQRKGVTLQGLARIFQGRVGWVALALILGGLGFGLGHHLDHREPPTFKRLTFRQGLIRNARLSPDGQEVLYSAAWSGGPLKVHSTRPDSPESRTLELPEADLLGLSRTGELAIALGSRPIQSWMWRGTLGVVPLAGGAPRALMEQVVAADWSPDGSELLVVRNADGKARLEFPLGHPIAESSGWISHPRVSPKGDRVAYLEHPVSGDDAGYPVVVDRQGNRHPLTGAWPSIQGLAWKGNEVWFTAATHGVARGLYAVGSGEPRLVLNVPAPLTLHDISRDGRRVLLAKEVMRTGIQSLRPGADRERELSWLDWSLVQDLSADGSTLIFNEQGEGSGIQYDIYLRKTDGSPAVRLAKGAYPILSPDGGRVAALAPGTRNKIQIFPTGAGEVLTLASSGLETIHRLRWFPDGRRLLVQANRPGEGTRLFAIPLDGRTAESLTAPGYQFFGQPISPDGRRITTRLSEQEDRILSLEDGKSQPIPGLHPLERVVRWAPDGKGLWVVDLHEMPCTVTHLDLTTGARKKLLEIAPEDLAGMTVSNFLLTPDARGYAYAYRRVLSELYLYEGLR
ncbi:MAG TPA: protein kinase [Geothrix sp.]|uniref:serine/threonine-protein kinase n=1 Tax=Geothrix mesophila TaxID=2922723 RepID=UPI0024349785|nr:serine/threonine-protein kinase [Geothrix sp. SG198]HJV39964.1 protein kinase [Geothrix sp.]